MRKIVYKSTAIKAVIMIIALILIVSVFPLGMWRTDKKYEVPRISDEKTQVINYRNNVTEIFVASGTHLQNIRVYVAEGTYDDNFTVSLYDGKGPLLSADVECPENGYGYVDILIDEETVPGELYIVKFESMQSVYIGLEDFKEEYQVPAVPFYNDASIDGKMLDVSFEYREPLGLFEVLFAIGMIAFIAILLVAVLDLTFSKLDKSKNNLITVESTVKATLNPIVVALLLICSFAIFTGKVSAYLVDNIFAFISVILLGMVLFYAINHKKDPKDAFVNADYIRSNMPQLIQSLGIAYAIQGCCEYVSALYDINHYVAERKELIGIAIAIIAMFEAKELFNIVNLCYTVLASIAAFVYVRGNITIEMTKDDAFLIKANALIAYLLGLIIIKTIKNLFDKEKSFRLKPIYAFITGVYFALIVIFRNTRWWTVLLVVSFVLICINLGYWAKRKTFMTNVIRGAVLQFICMTIWTLLHRPYATFRTMRFPHFFHTETVTATYLTLIVVIAMVLFLSKVKRCMDENKDASKLSEKIPLRDIFKELLFFGIAFSYMIFTMARTALFAVIAAYLFVFIMVFKDIKKDRIKALLRSIALLAGSLLVMFPITFEAQRTIPCLVSEPYEYDIEDFEDVVMHGRNLNSDCYMLIGRLGVTFCDKILGIGSEHFSPYYIEQINFDENYATKKEIYESGFYQFKDFDIKDEEWDERPNHDEWQGYVDRNGKNFGLGEDLVGEELEQAIEEAKIADAAEVEEEPLDYTNGRLDIYKSYIAQLNMTGHDSMGAILKNGEEATHAHDVYLQVAFDHGIPTGIVFVIFGIASFIMGVIYYIKSDDKFKALPMTITVAFAVAGVVEWVFHFSHPMSFVMLLTFLPLVYKER